MLKLKFQYSGHLMRRTNSFEKTLILGIIEGRRRRGQQRMKWLNGITDSIDMNWVNSKSCWWTGRPGALQFMGSQRAGHDWVTEMNWLKEIGKRLHNDQGINLKRRYNNCKYICTHISSVQFSCSVMSNCLQLHGLQHDRLISPSPTPGACSNSCQWRQ